MCKTLEPNQDRSGYFRQIGYKREGSRSQPKFRLGKDRVQAIERLAKIMQLWQWKCEQHPPAIWGPFEDVAKAIGRGEKQCVLAADRFANPGAYQSAIAGLSDNPIIDVLAEDDAKQQVGKALLRAIGEGAQLDAKAKAAMQTADDWRKLAGDAPLSGSLHQVLDAFHDSLPKVDGSISDHRKKLQRQTKTLKALLPNVALSQLDQDACEGLYKTMRERPTKADGSHYAKKYCQHLISCLSLALQAADSGEQFRWELPRKFHRIKTKVDRVEADDHKRIEIPIFTINDLRILWQFARPQERLLLALGLNCAMGADQIGRLQMDRCHLKDDGKVSYIKSRRYKKDVMGLWRIWDSTKTLIQWAIDNRPKTAVAKSHRLLLVNSKGKGLYVCTDGGERSRQIANMWYRLLDRAAKKAPQFAKLGSKRLGFNSLRDTSAQMVRNMAGGELASIHLAHKHGTSDELLVNYTNPTFKQLAKIHHKMERKLAPLWAAVDDPTQPPPRPNSSAFKRQKMMA